MARIRGGCLVGILCLLARISFAQQPVFAPEMKPRIDAAIQKVLAQSGAPSVQIGIAERSKVVFTQAYGLGRVEPPIPASVDMVYSIGSVSKQFTAAAVMLLAERGKLRFDDPVSTWFPELAHAQEITLRMLLNQVSGYADYYPESYLTPEMTIATTPLALVTRWTAKPLGFAPGTKWQYSNTNYDLAALIVEKVAGQPFFSFLAENLLRPAGLTHVIDLGGHHVPAVPLGYVHLGLEPPRPARREAHGTLLGAGDLAMPIGDLLLWDTVVMQRKVLKPTSWQVLQADFNLPDGTGTGYGMGYSLQAQADRRVVEHDGGLEGFTTLNEIFPESGIAIGVLTNADANVNKLVRAVQDVLFAPANQEPVRSDLVARTATKAELDQLAEGRVDRSLLNANLSFFFTDQVIADYKSSLIPFGKVQRLEVLGVPRELGDLTAWRYEVTADHGSFVASIYIAKDGKLDQLFLRR